jgi:hypothetical protein
MTVDVARRRTRRTTKVAPTAAPASPMIAESISIGEIEPTLFSCPNCQRPLAIGAHRCPGCRTHLVNGVQVGKASVFVIAGLTLGLALGGVVAGVSAMSASASRDAEIAERVAAALAAANVKPVPLATAHAIATSAPLATAKPGGGAAGIPSLARSALTRAAAVNASLASAVPVLQSALVAKEFDTYTVFQVLRSVSGDAVTGRQLIAPIAGWSGGKEVAENLAAYYTQLQQAAGDGLSASIRNTAAYKAAAKDMLELLTGLTALDAQMRSVAADGGFTIPPPEAP